MRQFLLILGHFSFFAPLLTPKIKIWKKRKKTPGQILLHMCTINQDHMMYGFWDIKFNRQNFVVILGNFLPFYLPPPPPNTLKNENIKNEKKTWIIIKNITILHKCTKNHDLLYCSRDMVHEGCNCYFHFRLSHIFPSTFLQPVDGRKNSILNWVIKLILIKLPMKFYSSKKNCCRCRQTMCRLCFCSQREYRK